MLAEQQRAKSEIEAALTIAAARPRDEKECLDKILLSCQRPGLAGESQYSYSRGGTAISGPSIKLMEVVAQKWGNIDFGFRELARYPGTGGRGGESVVEAFAWDLESNTRRKVQFTVQHVREKKLGSVAVTEPRDIYELVANQAQRRVRTCLENIIPRDIADAACDECDKTLKADIKDVGKASEVMLKAFLAVGISREQIEARIQRRLDAITPAQIIGLRKVYTSIKDGMSEAVDWFPVESDEDKKSTLDKAKDALRKTTRKAEGNSSPQPQAAPPAAAGSPAAAPNGDERQDAPSDAQGVNQDSGPMIVDGIDRQAIRQQFEMFAPGEESKACAFRDSLTGPDAIIAMLQADRDWVENEYQRCLTRLVKDTKTLQKTGGGKAKQGKAF